jgi:cytoplasmic tRNA 2-thiolation protein 1
MLLALRVTVTAMAPKSCALCQNAKAILRRPKTGQQICKGCFFEVFETEVHNTITQSQLFKPGDRVAIGASGGKGIFFFLMGHCPV